MGWEGAFVGSASNQEVQNEADAQALCAAAVAFAAVGTADAATLDTVKQRGVLNCGANGQIPALACLIPRGIGPGWMSINAVPSRP